MNQAAPNPQQDTASGFQFEFAGARFIAQLSGALYWPEHKTLLVADLHLEKKCHHSPSPANSCHLMIPARQ